MKIKRLYEVGAEIGARQGPEGRIACLQQREVRMGKLLSNVEKAAWSYHELERELGVARKSLRIYMRQAHAEGISMNKIAKAAGLTREGVRYALKDSGRETADA